MMHLLMVLALTAYNSVTASVVLFGLVSTLVTR